MPRGKRKYNLVPQGVAARKSKPAPTCQVCSSKLFRGVTCPNCDYDLFELFAECVLDGSAKVTLDEALWLGIPTQFASPSVRMAG